MFHRFFLAALTLLLPMQALAVPDAVVEAVRLPAWVDRDGATVPLAVGMALKDGDVLRTGAGSRLLLRTADGSAVKLGEDASLRLERLAQKKDLFSAALEVAKGAFRFTTRAVAKAVQREVSIRVGTATAGIRGTDLWGKSDEARDLVCLIEGRIQVTRGQDAPVELAEPLSFYVAPKDAAPLPVAKVDPEQLRKWAAETEIASGHGALREGGKWKANLRSLDDEAAALAAYDELRAAGYPVTILPVRKDEKWFYRLRIGDLPSKSEAEALARSLKGRFGISDPWVSQQ